MRRTAAVLQLLMAVSFVVSAVVAALCGPGAQAAAEAEIVRQGLSPDVLARNGVRFDETPLGIALPVGIALLLTVLGLLNLAGRRSGRIASLMVQPLVLIASAVIMAGQVFVVRLLRSALPSSVDVQALVDAALTAFPGWYPMHMVARLILATLGSLIVIVFLAVRPGSGRS